MCQRSKEAREPEELTSLFLFKTKRLETRNTNEKLFSFLSVVSHFVNSLAVSNHHVNRSKDLVDRHGFHHDPTVKAGKRHYHLNEVFEGTEPSPAGIPHMRQQQVGSR